MTRPALIVGNGPSIRGVDLASIGVGSTVFACNKIHQHPSWVDGWRPDAWVLGDKFGTPEHEIVSLVEKHAEGDHDIWVKSSILEICSNTGHKASDRWRWFLHDQIRTYANCAHSLDWTPNGWHEPHICCFSGSVYSMVQIAVLEYGCDQISFIGIDGNIKRGKSGNHFTDDYQSVWYGPPLVDRINKELQLGHEMTARELSARSIPAINLTPNSAFKMYESVAMERFP